MCTIFVKYVKKFHVFSWNIWFYLIQTFYNGKSSFFDKIIDDVNGCLAISEDLTNKIV